MTEGAKKQTTEAKILTTDPTFFRLGVVPDPDAVVAQQINRSIQIVRYDNVRMLKKPLKPTQLDYLKALDLTEDIFTSSQPPPSPEKLREKDQIGCEM